MAWSPVRAVDWLTDVQRAITHSAPSECLAPSFGRKRFAAKIPEQLGDLFLAWLGKKQWQECCSCDERTDHSPSVTHYPVGQTTQKRKNRLEDRFRRLQSVTIIYICGRYTTTEFDIMITDSRNGRAESRSSGGYARLAWPPCGSPWPQPNKTRGISERLIVRTQVICKTSGLETYLWI